MKRIALLACGLLLLVVNTAEARRYRRTSNNNYTYNYTQPVRVANATTTPAASAQVEATSEGVEATPAGVEASPAGTEVRPASYSLPTPTAPVSPVSYSTSTAQGVANLMASYNRVGHFGGNPGYEGCGCGATPQAAYSICCYGNSGMATVDVGYARSASGMWYCCRRYR